MYLQTMAIGYAEHEYFNEDQQLFIFITNYYNSVDFIHIS